MTLEIRPGLHIRTRTMPGSGYIQWWIRNSQRYMFNPSNGSLWPYDSDSTLEYIDSMISPSDLTQITKRLLQFDKERRKPFTGTNGGTPLRRAHDEPSNRVRDPRDLRHFILFVGSPSGRSRIDPLEFTGVCTRVGALFPGFTIQRAEGCFESRFEESLMIHIATREPKRVLRAAHDLRCFLNQTGIGISHNGIYQGVRDCSDDALILESLGCPHICPTPDDKNDCNQPPTP